MFSASQVIHLKSCNKEKSGRFIIPFIDHTLLMINKDNQIKTSIQSLDIYESHFNPQGYDILFKKHSSIKNVMTNVSMLTVHQKEITDQKITILIEKNETLLNDKFKKHVINIKFQPNIKNIRFEAENYPISLDDPIIWKNLKPEIIVTYPNNIIYINDVNNMFDIHKISKRLRINSILEINEKIIQEMYINHYKKY